ncbi:MAG: thiol:disulfide interchange protein DsbA [Pseudohongiellaceae bacterium]|jgi:thiol:disulfide interchange protein DsbA
MLRTALSARPLLTIMLSVIAMLVIPQGVIAADEYEAGKSYIILDQPVRTRDSSKVEVVEVFWYGCGHCFNFEPLLKQWQKKLSADVDYWQSPAMWNGPMKTHAQMFFTAKSLGVLEKLHMPIFTAMNVERKRLGDIAEIEQLFADFGVDREEFRKTFNSFSITSQVKQADARARSYKVSGTPEMVVNGKYRVTGGLAGGQPEMLKVVDYLVKMERAKLAAK